MKKKIGNSWGVGVTHDLSGIEIPRWVGGGGIIGRTIRGGGYGYFVESHNINQACLTL